LNFPEEDVEDKHTGRFSADLRVAGEKIQALLKTARFGILLREGVVMAICGKPNVGKSSLLNGLLRQSRAIVTDVAGTTRDVLQETANIRGIALQLADTAGILEPRDQVEVESVRRSKEMMSSADVVLLVLDRSRPLDTIDRDLITQAVMLKAVIVLNKCDLPAAFSLQDIKHLAGTCPVVEISALAVNELGLLEDTMLECVLDGQLQDTSAVLLTNARHEQSLRKAVKVLDRSLSSIENAAPLELVSDDVKTAIIALDAVTGKDVDADVIDAVFSRFCIGK